MDSAENGDKGLTVEEPHLCTGEKQVQSAEGSNNGADKEQPREDGASTREQAGSNKLLQREMK